MKTCQIWLKICILFVLICIFILLVTNNPKQQQVDMFEKNVNEKLVNVLLELNLLHKTNAQLEHQVLVLTQRLRIGKNSYLNRKKLQSPPKEYELLRRRIYDNMKEFWYYVSSELRLLANTDKGVQPFTNRMKKNVIEQYFSLLNDIAKLATVDDYTRWRRKEYIYLKTLVQKRLRFLQNPEDCSKAKKLICNLIPDRPSCGYGCRLHHLVNCLVVAYATKRTLVLDNPQNWEFTSGGLPSLFFPLSTCTSFLYNNETVLPWPGNESVQVVNLSLPIAVPDGPKRMARPLPPPFDPLVLPEDLSRRISVLHGDPAVWWIGQFVNYIIRLQLSTIGKFEEYEEIIEFGLPIVGVDIRRTDKIGSFHKLNEYMIKVDQYYKLQKMNGKNLYKAIYLASDDPALFEEAYKKYPDYYIFGNPELSKTGSVTTNELDKSILNINIDLYFLSQCDYLVCTFSSHVCRLAYEIINGIKPIDASTWFASLDDVYYFSDRIRRLHVAILPHKSNRPQEMDLQVGDEIEVVGNEWNGYSKGTHLKTNKTLLYPTFKVIKKIEAMYFTSYPDVKINSEELEN
ncbi:alpha-(1,6)-fucosyltransferase-like [Myzus persicae]|uniref:alpha-(1,6)-fucosyltransferase-like n=1 Tax=Myzus persicae TaxID=13164 RepID=UPI000B9365CB|nr:alpha-(1,6)-fucosyltransferase-like [Myzus persicae]XP_022177859.1 alpha-(1,6)-fucosyltransferase-like [Myzus persicae]XP_022177867.1 alpha-(1,6)-fucosyltransferase-like [Myzus persicae]